MTHNRLGVRFPLPILINQVIKFGVTLSINLRIRKIQHKGLVGEVQIYSGKSLPKVR